MNIENELKKDGIEVTEKLDDLTVNTIAKGVAKKLSNTFGQYGMNEAALFSKLSELNMYRAKMPEGMSEANYFYKNTSIYFNCNIPDEDLEEFAVHECIHFLQEVKDKKNNLIRMGLSDYTSGKVTGLGLNEAAVQLMASKAIGMEKDFVKYFGLSFGTISPSYYPIECCLVNQFAYLIGEEVLFDSTINSNDNFKNKFIDATNIKTFLCAQNAIDTILDQEESIIKLKNKMLDTNDTNTCNNMQEKIEEIKSEILLTVLRTQNFVISSYFNNSFKNIKNLEEVDNFRRKLYNMKDYLASTDGYTFYHDFYVEQMAKLEHKNNVLENGGTETALAVKKESIFSIIIKKIKEIFGKRDIQEN